jgi:hypothetical protein
MCVASVAALFMQLAAVLLEASPRVVVPYIRIVKAACAPCKQSEPNPGHHFTTHLTPGNMCVSYQVTALKVEVTQLQMVPGRGAVAVGTGVHETYPVQMVLKSIGYKSLPLEGVAFDPGAGIIPNLAGRVLQGGGQQVT